MEWEWWPCTRQPSIHDARKELNLYERKAGLHPYSFSKYQQTTIRVTMQYDDTYTLRWTLWHPLRPIVRGVGSVMLYVGRLSRPTTWWK
jgi:hypothetical protein